MTDRTAWRRVMAGTLVGISASGALIGLAGSAGASPTPGAPYTTTEQCTRNGGTVTAAAPGVERCTGGGDRGDVVVPDAVAGVIQGAVPKDPAPTPPLP